MHHADLRALFVAETPARVDNMIAVFQAYAAALDVSPRIFLFADRRTLLSAPDILAARWRDRVGEEHTLTE